MPVLARACRPHARAHFPIVTWRTPQGRLSGVRGTGESWGRCGVFRACTPAERARRAGAECRGGAGRFSEGRGAARQRNRGAFAMVGTKRSGGGRGFSLIELVVVVVILGILAAIAMPRMSRGAAGAADAALSGDLALLRSAIELYQTD